MRPENPSPTELTFPWGDRPLSLWRLLPSLFICAAILGFMALIFKIKTPPPERTHHLSQSILLLDSANPINQIVLNRAQDRSALILGTEAIDDLTSSTSLLPVFRPSFSGFQLQLKEAYVGRATTDQPRLFQPNDLALPSQPPPAQAQALPPDAASTRAGAKNWLLIPELHGSLTQRTLRSPPDLSSLRPQDLAKLRFQIAVKPNGRTLLVVPLHSAPEDREIIPALLSALSSIRFEPQTGTSLEWGQVSFAWTEGPSKKP